MFENWESNVKRGLDFGGKREGRGGNVLGFRLDSCKTSAKKTQKKKRKKTGPGGGAEGTLSKR